MTTRSHHRRLRLAASLWLCVLLVACGESPRFTAVIVVSVEGLRADHLGANGYPRDTTPFLDELAARSVSFGRAYAATSRGLASHASLHTGLAPGQHGLWNFGDRIDSDVPTLAERMGERGYTTAAFVSARQDWSTTGLTRGFDHFDEPSELHRQPFRRAHETGARALAWLEEQRGPAFVWIQLEDTTKPFEPLPEPAAAALQGVSREAMVEHLVEQTRLPLGYYAYQQKRMLKVVNRYDGELRGTDDALSALYAGLGSGGGAGSLWVVLGANGMGLGNHAWEGPDRQIYEVQVRVPLFLHAPGGEFAIEASDRVVSQLGLADALVRLTEPEAPGPQMLLPGENASGAFVQRGTLGQLGPRQHPPGAPEFDSQEQDAWVEGPWKLLRREHGDEQLFDVAEDPYETRDRVSDAPEGVLDGLRAALAEQRRTRGLDD